MTTFRFDRPSIEYITALIADILPRRKTKARRNLLPLDMVLIALQFYATGTFQTVVGNVLRYSQASVSRSIAAVSLSLSLISANHIRFPDNLNNHAFQASLDQSIDGTHIRIQRPILYEKAYVNRKNYHSINVQAICDAGYKFLSVCGTKPGSCHDSSIFKGSAIGKKFESGFFGTSILLGDSGYSNTPFLFIPYNDPVEGYKIRFNRAHKSTRCTIERSFGILKKRFHVLHSEIRMSPTKVSWVIVACCVLHNLAIDLKMPLDDNWAVDGDDFHQEENMPELEIRPTGTITQKEAALRRLGNTKRDRVASKTFPR
uniref:DDE Tnp4 domain-containing protein n=1 Tax=Daphnia galeata TaxID=27404 RepID=A0A8J2RX27_9CRUS|nr:unnamed protein product [Daphnia galeata]